MGVIEAGETETDQSWVSRAKCGKQKHHRDGMFVQGAEQNKAKVLCNSCPVRLECLAEALDNQIAYGVWGGLTERERRALLRKSQPAVSWRVVLEAARQRGEF